MKKYSLILLVGLCLIFVVAAQAQFKMAIGPAIGLNFNIHSGSDLQKTGTGFGLAIAGQADMSFSKTIGILTSLYFYDNRSGSYSMTGNYQGYNYTADVSASIAYFEIEPLFKLSLENSPIYIIAGPSLGFNVEGSNETTVTVQGFNSQTTKATIQNMLVRFEIKAGAGYAYPLSKSMRINSQFTFGYGITNVIKDVNYHILSFGLLTGIEFDVIK